MILRLAQTVLSVETVCARPDGVLLFAAEALERPRTSARQILPAQRQEQNEVFLPTMSVSQRVL